MNNNDDNAALPLENNDKINYRLLYADRIIELEAALTAAQERNVALQSEHLNHVSALHEQLVAAQEREAAYRNALMDVAKDFSRANMGNCCQHVMNRLNRIINKAEAADDHK